VVQGNRIWMLGGKQNPGGSAGFNYCDDAWWTTDGVNWTQQATGWPARTNFGATVHNGRIVLSGGYYGATTLLTDIWARSEAPHVTSVPATTATVGDIYSYDITATGAPIPAISVTGLPPWLVLTGTMLAGTPGAGDVGLSGTITITASSSAGVDTQNFQVDVLAGPPPPPPGLASGKGTGGGGAGCVAGAASLSWLVLFCLPAVWLRRAMKTFA
jgi:hypothetical protein